MKNIARKLGVLALEWEREADSEFRCAAMTRERARKTGFEYPSADMAMGARLVEHGATIKANHASQLRKLAANLTEPS